MTQHKIFLEANELSKKYCRNAKKNRRYGLYNIGNDLLGRPTNKLRDDEFWALKSVSLQLFRGESLGIIGSNGAGKSTLLKLLANILVPDSGAITTRGKVIALLEIGVGFNSILTGKENIYLNGSILGMSKKDIDQVYHNIVNFAELSDFIHSPLKTYSAGMKARLGFAIAITSKPDVVLLDETLVVGDIAFQAKCENEIKRLRKNGTGFIVVSQQIHSIMRSTQQCLWIEKGKLIARGKTDKICLNYVDHQLKQGKATYRNIALKKKLLINGHIGETQPTTIKR
jgi:lipopolysaccharide transport system ATP-binding protein